MTKQYHTKLTSYSSTTLVYSQCKLCLKILDLLSRELCKLCVDWHLKKILYCIEINSRKSLDRESTVKSGKIKPWHISASPLPHCQECHWSGFWNSKVRNRMQFLIRNLVWRRRWWWYWWHLELHLRLRIAESSLSAGISRRGKVTTAAERFRFWSFQFRNFSSPWKDHCLNILL